MPLPDKHIEAALQDKMALIGVARKLQPRHVAKPWGRIHLPSVFGDTGPNPIGEIWYEGEESDLPLLVKHIFTSEKLSIQVHPGDEAAIAEGLQGGKEEIWYILDCEPDARLGIGLNRAVSPEQFRAAALDGSIEQLINWKPVRPGDCYFIPAGTVHAIGAGIMLAEVQQNVDVTYRLYDYGRPRELHLDLGLAVSHLAPYDRPVLHAPLGQDAGCISPPDAPFKLELRHWQNVDDVLLPSAPRIWFTPLDGSGTINGAPWAKGDCWLIDQNCRLQIDTPCSALLATTP